MSVMSESDAVGGKVKMDLDAELEVIDNEFHEKAVKQGSNYCLCGNNDESSFMICCDHCGVWYHGACLQVTRTQANRIETYACPPCISKNSNLTIIYRAPPAWIKKEKNDVREKPGRKRSRNESKSVTKGETSAVRCNNCINCFRLANCGKCSNCDASQEPCLKRICLRAECAKKPQLQTKMTQYQPKSKKSCNLDDANVRPQTKCAQKKPGRKRGPQKRQAGIDKDNTTKEGSKEKKAAKEYKFSSQERMEVAAASYKSYHRGKGSSDVTNDEEKQCQGRGCTNSALPGSKFCNESCGAELANSRLRFIMPDRVKAYWDVIPNSVSQSEHLCESIEEHIQSLTGELRTFAAFQDEIDKWIAIMENVKPDGDDTATPAGSDIDFTLHCVVCAMEYPAKQFTKHVERCFVRNERQSCYGTPNRSNINPYNIFCDQFNKANNTFCKRLRVLCSEHYKAMDKVDPSKICGYPLAWAKTQLRPIKEMFNDMEKLIEHGFCKRRRKDCVQHHNWVQNAMGLIDVELLNHLMKLDECFEKKRAVHVSEAIRGNLLSLLLNKTYECKTEEAGGTSKLANFKNVLASHSSPNTTMNDVDASKETADECTDIIMNEPNQSHIDHEEESTSEAVTTHLTDSSDTVVKKVSSVDDTEMKS